MTGTIMVTLDRKFSLPSDSKLSKNASAFGVFRLDISDDVA